MAAQYYLASPGKNESEGNCTNRYLSKGQRKLLAELRVAQIIRGPTKACRGGAARMAEVSPASQNIGEGREANLILKQ